MGLKHVHALSSQISYSMRPVWQKHWRKVMAGLYLIVNISIPAFLLYGFAQRQACLQGTLSDLGVSDLKERCGNDAGSPDVTVVQLHIGYEGVCTNDQLTVVRDLAGLQCGSQSSTYIRKSIVSTRKSRALTSYSIYCWLGDSLQLENRRKRGNDEPALQLSFTNWHLSEP